MAVVKVQDLDNGWMRLEEIMRLGHYEIVLKAPPFYAPFLEFGTRKMAARPFMSWTWDERDYFTPEVRKLASTIMGAKIMQASSGVQALITELVGIGETAVKATRKVITGMGLIDTGRLLRSISYEIIGGGKTWLGGAPGLDAELPIQVGGAE